MINLGQENQITAVFFYGPLHGQRREVPASWMGAEVDEDGTLRKWVPWVDKPDPAAQKDDFSTLHPPIRLPPIMRPKPPVVYKKMGWKRGEGEKGTAPFVAPENSRAPSDL